MMSTITCKNGEIAESTREFARNRYNGHSLFYLFTFYFQISDLWQNISSTPYGCNLLTVRNL